MVRMQTATSPDLRFPAGRFEPPATITAEQRREWMAEIAALPAALRAAVAGLSDEQLDTPYRPEGWSVRQVVHHLPDSHMNSYVRFRLALTEDNPTVKPYDEALWAELPDAKSLPPELSLRLLEALHQRWVTLLEALTPEQYARTFEHPGLKRIMSLEWNLGLYAWHGRHHVAHITSLRQRMGW
jgi:hypothetical protein